MRNSKAFLIFIGIALCTSCASSKVKSIEAERVASSSVGTETPADFISDAMALKEFYIFPDPVVKKIEGILAQKKQPVESLRAVQGAICDGRRPRFLPKLTLQLIFPKPPSNLPLDLAVKMQRTLLYKHRQYLKSHYFDLASKRIHPILEGRERWDNNYSNYPDEQKTATFNPAFSSYKKFVLDNPDGNKAHWNGSSFDVPNDLLIPYLFTENKKEIIDLFSKIERVPDSQGVVKLDLEDPEYLPDHSISILFPKDKTGLLISRVLPAIKASWKVNSYQELEGPKMEFTVDERVAEDFFVISPHAWQITNHEDKGKVQPMHRVWFDDLAFLRDSYSFVMPKDVVRKLASTGAEDDNSHLDESWGYQDVGDDYVFSPNLALKNKSALWEHFFQTQTSVKEAPMPNGNVQIELSLNMEMFCTYAKPMMDLQAGH